MKKLVLTLVLVAVIAVALGSVGVTYAQTPSQPPANGAGSVVGRGFRSGIGGANRTAGEGILHDYMLASFAQKLNIPAADLEARITNGETIAQIAFSQGLTFEQFQAIMTEARSQAIDQALKDGKLTQAQADWLKQRGASQMGSSRMGARGGMRGSGQGQFANPSCPYYSQTNP